MAKAPRPGASERETQMKADQRIARVGFKGSDPVELAVDLIPITEKVRVRAETGLPYKAFWGVGDAIDVDSFAVLWWLARRANGERQLTFLEVAAECSGGETEDFSLVVYTPDEPSPDEAVSPEG